MRPVIGIDPSLTATGVCNTDGSTWVIKWPGRGIQRLQTAYQWIGSPSFLYPLELGDDAPPLYQCGLVVIEGYSMHSKGSAITGMIELGCTLRLALHHEGIDWIEIPPSTLKKYATGKGNANKDLVRDAARDRLGLPAGVTSDECDAVPLASPPVRSGHPWDALAQCESHGEWDYGPHSTWGSKRFHGGLQFHPDTWAAFKPAGYPTYAYQATREQQIVVGERVLAQQGWGAWPDCSRKLGLR